MIFYFGDHAGKEALLLDVKKEVNKKNVKVKLSFDDLAQAFFDYLSQNSENTLLLLFESCNGQGFWEKLNKKLEKVSTMRLKTRNLGGFISLVFQNTVSKIKAVTDFDACFSQFCDYTYESFIKPSLVASEFTQYLTENKIIYDKNDKMLLDVKLSLNEKYKNESYKSYYLIVNSKLWTNVVGFFQKFIFIIGSLLELQGNNFIVVKKHQIV